MKSWILSTAYTLLVAASLVSSEIFFEEKFDDDTWSDRWVVSKHKTDYGKWDVTPGKFYADEKESRGLKTTEDYRFYSIAAPFSKPLDTSKEPIVFQFSCKFEQSIDCGGGYFKLLLKGADPLTFHGETPYAIMFGPDVCGGNSRTHAILGHKGKNHLINKDIRAETDQLTHLYTFVLNPDKTFAVYIDGKKETGGNVLEHWDILEHAEMMDDPEDKKPEDFDTVPQYISDPGATKPEDWDDEMDGDWEAPRVQNPEWKGEWVPKKIKNPNYKGPWIHPEIDNPAYAEDDTIGQYEVAFAGIDIWQVKSGTIFDDILVTNDENEALEYGEKHVKPKQEKERKEKEKLDEEERKKMDEEAAKLKDKIDNKEDEAAPAEDDKDDDEANHDEL